MMKSFYTGITGLSSQADSMGVIGDNIANVKTVGFKSNRVSFANVLGNVMDGKTVGNGVQIWDVSTAWIQGAPETTGIATDLAINGRGLFMVNDSDGTTYYTRAGQFNFDKDRFLVNPDGLVLQGYPVDSDGALGAMSDIRYTNSPPRATEQFGTTVNLDADAVAGDTFMTTVTVYDSLGSQIDLNIAFENTGPGAWTWTPETSAGTVTGGGTLQFNAEGILDPATDATINITPSSGANPLDLTWVLSDGTVTGYASPSSTTYATQDGFPDGTLESVSIDQDGFVMGIYSNGEQERLYRIALADFPNYNGLNSVGDNLYVRTFEAGDVTEGTPSNGRLGTLTSGALEMSNVDLSREFVNLITTQRAYQANSKVIITSDEMLAELMNIKR